MFQYFKNFASRTGNQSTKKMKKTAIMPKGTEVFNFDIFLYFFRILTFKLAKYRGRKGV